jgi:hypothetical protein
MVIGFIDHSLLITINYNNSQQILTALTAYDSLNSDLWLSLFYSQPGFLVIQPGWKGFTYIRLLALEI